MEWDGVGWSGMDWDGVEWIGLEWNAIQRKADELARISHLTVHAGIELVV